MKTNTGNTIATVSIIIGIIIIGAWFFMSRNPSPDLLNGTSTNPTTQTSSTDTTNTPDLVDDTAGLSTTTAPTPGNVAHINGKDLKLIISDTPGTRELGLGQRDNLPADEGMLFVFEKPDTYEFWMKDMKFSLDMIWLDSSFKIVHIAPNVSPDTYPDTTFKPEKPASYVLEVNANFAAQNKLHVGDVVQISLKK